MGRPAFPVAFGSGLDRASGTTVESEAMDELENVVLERGRVVPRGGMESKSVLGAAAYVAGMHPDRSTLRAVHVGGFGAPGTAGHALRVYRTLGSGANASLIGDWASPCQSQEKARVMAAQSGALVFLAHEEPSIGRRAPLVAVDAGARTITEIAAAWAAGDLKLRPRGCSTWLDYLVLWGFGTNTDDEPHMVRISDPALPSVFQETAFVKTGQPGDAVMVCAPTRGGLLIFKEASTWILTGTDANSFGGPFEVDSRYGCAAPRLCVSDGQAVHYWSLEGPRVQDGGASKDISWPLGLRPWPTPEDVAAAGRLQSGFAEYDPATRSVLFVFGDWVYDFSVQRQEWSHRRLGASVHCGAVLFARSGYEGASRGYPDFGAATAMDSDTLRVTWSDQNQEGDETLEVWAKPSGGAWYKAGEAQIEAGAFVDVDLAPGEYEVALRYSRDDQYSAGTVTGFPAYDYTGAPDTWPAVSRGTGSLALPAPSVLSGTWSRTDASTEQIALAWTNGYAASTEILRGGAVIATVASSVTAYTDTTMAGEAEHTYTVRHIAGALTSAASNAAVVWAGPLAPSGLARSGPVVGYGYNIAWALGAAGAVTAIEDDYVGAAGVYAARLTTAADATSAYVSPLEKSSALDESMPGNGQNINIGVRVRHAATAHGVTDYSAWHVAQITVLIATDETAGGGTPA